MVNADSMMVSGDLDEIDRQIVAALQKDGREAFAQIAERLNVSAGMIRMRYNHLVELGVLRVVGVTNPMRMGYNTMALIGVKVEGDKLMDVANRIATLDEVVYLIIVSGSYDLIVEVMCRDQEHLLQFLTHRLYMIEGVRESESFIHLKIIKEIYF
jgi:Lrp/AsnC family transcriptional regulator for asnA, asnC and gidA